MTNPVFIARGNGYAGCTAFDGFTVLAHPVADRESRIFGETPGKPHSGTCYRAHSIQIACREGAEDSPRKELYLLIEHGGGREVVRVPSFYDGGETTAALLALPERAQYGLAFTLYKIAQNAAEVARQKTARAYGMAFLDGRMKKRRSKTAIRLEILTGYFPTVNGQEIGERGFLKPEEATAAAKAHAEAKGLADAKLGWVGRS